MSGKLQVVSAILKLDKPFRPPHIIDMTGLPRELVYYHLKTMCNEGWVTKTGRVYEVSDKEELLNSLVEIAERTETRKMEANGTLWASDSIKTLNGIAEGIVCSLALGDKEIAPEARSMYISKIDKTMKELKQLRKFLNNSQRTELSAAKKLQGQLDDLWESWIGLGLVPSTGKKEWKDSLAEKIEGVLDD